MKTEKEKMLSNELYNHKDAELTKERNHAYELTLRYNQTKDDETELRTSILQQLAGKLGNNVVIKPPFQCDYGYNLILGDNVFMNYGCSILDCNVVEIGNNVLMAPNVQIYAAYHPTDHTLRLKDLEYADRVKIGDNTWIGGGSIILNGVTIGKNTVIGAGSVVTKDIPDNVVAVGNPCRVIKRLDKENVENGKRLKFTDFAHINIVVDDIDEGIKYYEQLLEAKPIQIFREFSNIGFAKAAGFLEHPELVKLSIAFMEIPGIKLTLELMEYYEPVTTDAKVVSLGGATEAAIWSIYHEIEEVPDGAVSIPYGKPLANQKFYVLNEKMEQCPDWVPGDLYIGGKGLALEYLNKPEETNAHFMYDEQLQERIYKTGDIGRYWPDGTIEFMGREDTQVKIHGHRIELSEIESALLSNTLVKTAVAVIVGKRPQDYKIVAFVEGNIEVSELTEYIKTQVPEYMVPSRFEVNEKIPLSANGKVERKALKKLAETYFQNTGKCEMPPHEGLEKEIAELWKTLLKIDRVNRTDNFYDIGGDSLLVAQAVSKTKEAINVAKDVEWDRLMIGMLQNPTIMDFAQFLNSVQIGTSHEENEISETPLNIIADIPEGGEVMKVFFPGGIGFLQQFNTLFQILVNNPERTEGIAAFNYTEDKEYLDSEEKDHIVTIGRRYADLLLNSGYRKFKLIGYCMGGLVAIEAARALLEAGAEVLPVVTIDTIPIVLEMEGDLLMERSYGLMVGADVSKAGHVKRDELVQMALELLKDHNNGFIEEDAILGLTGELSELAACYKKQKTLSKRERMENLKNAIPENSMQLSSEDMNRFDELFEIYKRNYRCAIGYTPKPFAGDLQALSCMDDHSPFVPVMKPGTEAFLSKCALGNLEVLPIGGNHLSCLMTPNVEGMANLLDGKGERV